MVLLWILLLRQVSREGQESLLTLKYPFFFYRHTVHRLQKSNQKEFMKRLSHLLCGGFFWCFCSRCCRLTLRTEKQKRNKRNVTKGNYKKGERIKEEQTNKTKTDTNDKRYSLTSTVMVICAYWLQ